VRQVFREYKQRKMTAKNENINDQHKKWLQEIDNMERKTK
jgi:hypothetical protein